MAIDEEAEAPSLYKRIVRRDRGALAHPDRDRAVEPIAPAADPAPSWMEETFPVFYRAHCDFVLGVALRMVGRIDVAEDVSQDVFMKVWTRPDAYDPNRGGVRTWLRLTTRSTAIERLRRDTATERRDRTEAGDRARLLRAHSVEQGAFEVLRSYEIERAIAKLPKSQRVAIELAYINGKTYQEVAVFTGTPEGTIKSRIRTGLQRLAETVDSAWLGPMT